MLIDKVIHLSCIGDSGVGKTSLSQRFCDDSFTSPVKAPTCPDFWLKVIQCGETNVKVALRETVGPFRNFFCRGAKGILLVYDVSDEVSFINIRNWMKVIHENASADVNILLIGNKCDVDPSERKISFEKGKELADKYDIKFFETSAKLKINVNECFLDITKDRLERLKENDRVQKALDLKKARAKNETCFY